MHLFIIRHVILTLYRYFGLSSLSTELLLNYSPVTKSQMTLISVYFARRMGNCCKHTWKYTTEANRKNQDCMTIFIQHRLNSLMQAFR